MLHRDDLTEDRKKIIVKMICQRGNAEDLNEILSISLSDQWPVPLRIEALDGLLEASQRRKIQPDQDSSPLLTLLSSENPDLQKSAIKLIGFWKLPDAESHLLEIVKQEETPAELQKSILTSLLGISPEKTQALLEEMAGSEEPLKKRMLAINLLLPIDLSKSAELTLDLYEQVSDQDDPSSLLNDFLSMQNGEIALMQRLAKEEPSDQASQRLVNSLNSLGKTDTLLYRILQEKNKTVESDIDLSPEGIAALLRDVETIGDPQRGEEVFRREQLTCMKCHSIHMAGGNVGPDLSSIGVSSPIAYLLNSIIDPDLDIKEAYATRTFLTDEGRIFQGVIASRTDEVIMLKEASGKMVLLTVAEIEQEQSGGSLMPRGLINQMSREDLVDLVRFLSELGKPGPYEIRSSQRFQKYLILMFPARDLDDTILKSLFGKQSISNPEIWTPAYAKVNGDLPVREIAQRLEQDVVYAMVEINCHQPGNVNLKLDSTEGVSLWNGQGWTDASQVLTMKLNTGRQPMILKIEESKRTSDFLKIELERVEGSKAEFHVVDAE